MVIYWQECRLVLISFGLTDEPIFAGTLDALKSGAFHLQDEDINDAVYLANLIYVIFHFYPHDASTKPWAAPFTKIRFQTSRMNCLQTILSTTAPRNPGHFSRSFEASNVSMEPRGGSRWLHGYTCPAVPHLTRCDMPGHAGPCRAMPGHAGPK